MDLWKFARGRETLIEKNDAAAGQQSNRTGRSLKVKAVTESLEEVNAFVAAYLEENEASMKTMMQVELALEEAFVNIVSYAYPDGEGEADVYVGPAEAEVPPAEEDAEITEKLGKVLPDGDLTADRTVCIALMDSGIPYDPLLQESPDISLPASEREIGGLGIFLIRKNMDGVKYTYCCGHNLLVMYKKF